MRLLFSLALLAFVLAVPLGCEKKTETKDSPKPVKDKPQAPPAPPAPPPPPK